MDNWTIALICFGGFLFLYVVYGLLLPRKWEIKESILVVADRDKLFDYLNHIKNWEAWTNWNSGSKIAYEFSYEGPEAGKGATQKWTARKRYGQTEIKGGNQPERIDFQFVFGKGQQRMDGSLNLVPEAEGIRVDWLLEVDAGENLNSKITAKMMKPYIIKDLKAGLDRLQKICKTWNYLK